MNEQLRPPSAPTPSKTIAVGGEVTAIIPQSLQEVMVVARGVVEAGFAPYALIKNKSGDKAATAVAVCIMAGAELGLPPMVSLRAFTVINGRPALYGDGLMAVLRKSGKMKSFKQGYDHATETGWAESERKDTGEVMRYEFTKPEAIMAGLWQDNAEVEKKENGSVVLGADKKPIMVPNQEPWYRYRPRMMQIRARTYLARDLYADVLGGMTDEYEARDIPEVEFEEVRQSATPPSAPKPEPIVPDEDPFDPEAYLTKLDDEMSFAMTQDDVAAAFDNLAPQIALADYEASMGKAFELRGKHFERVKPPAEGFDVEETGADNG